MNYSKEPLVMHVLGALVRHGAELRTMELIRQVKSDPHSPFEQAVITLMPSDPELVASLERTGVKVFQLHVRSVLFISEFLRLLRQVKPIIVHSHVNLLSGFLLTLVRLGARVPGRIAHFRGENTGDLSRLRVTILRKMVVFGANQILAVSPNSLSSNWDVNRSAPAEVILSGLTLSPFEGSIDRNAILNSLGLAQATNLILHVGRDDAVKNRARAIDIFESYRQGDPNAVLCFVGEHAGRGSPAWHKDDPTSRILYLGRRRDVPSLLRSASLLLCTSLSEGLPGVVLEALVAGVPVVSTALPGVEYLSREIFPITMVDLSETDATWRDAISFSYTPAEQVDRRSTRVNELRGSKFDGAVAYQQFLRVWGQFA